MNRQPDKALYDTLNTVMVLHEAANNFIFAKYGQPKTHYFALEHLYLTPDLTLSQISRLILADLGVAATTVETLETAGLVVRHFEEQDDDLVTFSLTGKGAELYIAMRDDLNADIRQRFEKFTHIEKQQLNILNRHLLRKLHDHRQQQEATA